MIRRKWFYEFIIYTEKTIFTTVTRLPDVYTNTKNLTPRQ